MPPIPLRKHIRTAEGRPDPAGSFSIREIGSLLLEGELVQDPHRHDFFIVLVLKTGSGKHVIDFRDYPVKGNTVFILRPGQVHSLQLRKNCSGYILQFGREFYPGVNGQASEKLRRVCMLNCRRLAKNEFLESYRFLELMQKEYREKQSSYPSAIQAGLELFFIGLLRTESPAGKQQKNHDPYTRSRYEELLELLETEITRLRSSTAFASRMHLSLYQLNRITKASSGKTVSELISEQTLLEAKRLLFATPQQIKEIAGALGFEDASYFTRFFRKHTGLSPEAWRQQSG